MKPWKREALSIVVAIVTFMLALTMTMAALAFFDDLPPDGADCTYPQSGGSGSQEVGREEIRWSFLPDRTCVIEGRSPSSGTGLSRFGLAGLTGLIAGGAAGAFFDRAIRRRGDAVGHRPHRSSGADDEPAGGA